MSRLYRNWSPVQRQHTLAGVSRWNKIQVAIRNHRITNTIDILWDGEVALAVEKPAGLPTQAPAGIDSLESTLRDQLADRSEYVRFPHRLDRPVGGVILVALTKRAANLLSGQFASRKVEKRYLAFVEGKFDSQQATWIDFVRKVPGQPEAEISSEEADDSRIAETGVERLQYDETSDQTLLRLTPLTGRMHQLRVQAAHRGHPIAGDVRYGAKQLTGRPENPGSGEHERILLRAQEISFHDPRNGVRVDVTASDKFRQSV